ncbi:MAG TPA: hypothetical protein PLE24_09255 [Chitinispirillaceae bacterium]|jgi:hypothetical protein|nr:hypothetical protein [Chitinispirillaceae bacterium]
MVNPWRVEKYNMTTFIVILLAAALKAMMSRAVTSPCLNNNESVFEAVKDNP